MILLPVSSAHRTNTLRSRIGLLPVGVCYSCSPSSASPNTPRDNHQDISAVATSPTSFSPSPISPRISKYTNSIITGDQPTQHNHSSEKQYHPLSMSNSTRASLVYSLIHLAGQRGVLPKVAIVFQWCVTIFPEHLPMPTTLVEYLCHIAQEWKRTR